ncbi:hypothetical protein CSB45_01865 [candidate division KSB3 bacterium]|uniref:Uncharacterized protein n=1 Tax=candidate division KSB3 bacterium TaxID=2044937 RepID=A0A2G6E9L4_9BACT|nr:MAG: hypothetical protein CSB45_01865 [candidate division KSB3 bacterium]
MKNKQLSYLLRKRIVDFLVSLPGINDTEKQQALLQRAGLDRNLVSQLRFNAASGQFFQLLVSTAWQYGRLEDGREALVAVLQAAKDSVGLDKQVDCERLIRELSAPVQQPQQDQPQQNRHDPKKILFLSANPTDQSRLQTDKEYRMIKAEMERGQTRDVFTFLPPQFAVTITELLRAMNDKPQIVHFSGHGETEGIVIAADSNATQRVPARALKRLFAPLKGITELVLLNSCYSAEQAKMISACGMCVIGMNVAVDDEAAISFAKGLYNGLGAGKTPEAAYNDAMIVLETEHPHAADVVEVWKNGEQLEL